MEEIEIEDKENLGFRGSIEIYESEEDFELGKYARKVKNLYLDDGKELTLDFLFGLVSWWNPQDQEDYDGSNGNWDTSRYMGFGTCMFSNSSFARASGMEGIASGTECDYPVDDTYLVEPEDSYLSKEVGSRVLIIATRRDQGVEMRANIQVPGDLPIGTSLREFIVSLKSTGPSRDPSLSDSSKPYSSICRSALAGTGWYREVGGISVPCSSTDPGATLCYYDDPYEVDKDIILRWKFGEI